ncbi:MAG: hypothetical protein Q8R44_04530 [Novosphingobium sp.]|nr:hypothetical protein [Novosphingobium sp.]
MLIREIERFLRSTGLAPTTFGRLAASDPRLVFDMRNGREPRESLRSRVEHFMNTFGDVHHAR